MDSFSGKYTTFRCTQRSLVISDRELQILSFHSSHGLPLDIWNQAEFVHVGSFLISKSVFYNKSLFLLQRQNLKLPKHPKQNERFDKVPQLSPNFLCLAFPVNLNSPPHLSDCKLFCVRHVRSTFYPPVSTLFS